MACTRSKDLSARKGKSASKAAADGETLEGVSAQLKRLQKKQAKLKQAEAKKKQEKKKKADELAEKQERQYNRNHDGRSTQQQRQSPPDPPRGSRPAQQSSDTAVEAGLGDNDDCSVNFGDDDDDDFVAEVRQGLGSQGDRESSIEVVAVRKRKTPLAVDEDEDSDKGPTTPIPAKKKKGSGAVTLTVAAAQPMKASKTKRKHNISNNPSDSSESDSEKSESDSEVVVGEFTPYKRVVNKSDKNKPRLKDFSPTTAKLAKRVRDDFTMHLVTSNPFLDEDNAKELVGELFALAVDEAQPGTRIARRAGRFVASTEYQTDIENVGKNADLGFRGRVVVTAQPLVDQKYGFEDDGKTNDDRQKLAEALLKDGAFAFADWKKRTGYLLNPLITKILGKHFLVRKGRRGKALVTHSTNMNLFKEMPDPLIAFILTVIHCAIDSWKSGVFKKAEFSLTDYQDKYKDHLASIETAAAGNKAGVQRLRKKLWEAACDAANIAPSISVEEDNRRAGYLAQSDLSAVTEGW